MMGCGKRDRWQLCTIGVSIWIAVHWVSLQGFLQESPLQRQPLCLEAMAVVPNGAGTPGWRLNVIRVPLWQGQPNTKPAAVRRR
mmetsp:Transcript_110961/g.324584  ORF Transcript_110961/g.324584 Transcript_110961/m.324584 type:complete len:84 (-) Transcript_110961:133-384(-)